MRAFLSEVDVEYVVIQIIHDKESFMTTHLKSSERFEYGFVRIPANQSQAVSLYNAVRHIVRIFGICAISFVHDSRINHLHIGRRLEVHVGTDAL
jgi:hypothetical protein